MLPGKTYTPEDFFEIAWRLKWTILVPFVLVTAGALVMSHFLPDKYRSETLVLVVPQRVPESYVRSTVTARIEDRLQSISQQILSRTRLERIIQEFKLYMEQRPTTIMEDLVEQMREDIHVDIIRGDAFRISYVGEEPRTVMRVTERLASLFIEENLRDRELLAEGTNQFLETQLEDARRRLVEHEKRLETYRKRHSGELPSQAQSNLQVVQNTQMQIQAVLESLNRDRDRKLIVERAIADLMLPDNDPTVFPTAVGPEAADTSPGSSVTQQLARAKQALAALEIRLRPEHPDVIKVKRLVAELERRETEVLERPVSPEAPPSRTPAQLAKRNRIKELESELANLDRQIGAKQTEERRLRQVAANYQARVEMVPTREAEMTELTRDYATLQQVYANLLSKQEDSKVAANLERRQVGEQFKLLDPARLPEKSFSPNRTRINLGGALLGLAIGIGLAGLIVYRDSTFRTDTDVTAVLALPVLAQIPLMMDSDDRRRLRRKRILLSMTAVIAVVLASAGAAAFHFGVLGDFLK